jgi:hypothetical protein
MKTFHKMRASCWKGYKAIGTKEKNGRTVPNCVPVREQGWESEHAQEPPMQRRNLPNKSLDFTPDDKRELKKNIRARFKMGTKVSESAPAWTRKEGKNPTGGLNKKGIDSYRREHPGSHLSLAVTTPPSKLNPDSKAAGRRRSFCARMGGSKGPMKKPNGEPTRKALALRKWHC